MSMKYTDSSQAEDALLGLAAVGLRDQWLDIHVLSPAGPDAKNVRPVHHEGDSLTRVREDRPRGAGAAREMLPNRWLDSVRTRVATCTVPGRQYEPFAIGYAPIDERPACAVGRAESSANTNDLRGKILRIHPERRHVHNPAGNFFSKEIPFTRRRSTPWVTGTRIASL